MSDVSFAGGVRLLTLITALGLSMASGVVGATTTLNSIKIYSGADQHTCTMSAFSVSAGVVSATVTACTPALTGSETGGGTGGETGGGTGGETGGGTGGETGGETGGGVGGGDSGSGSWSPDLSATPRVVVVGQSGGATDAVTVVPGCVNGGSTANGSTCSKTSEYSANINGTVVKVAMTQGQILSIRYPVSGVTTTSGTGSLKLANSVGGAIGIDTLISLSPIPGDMTGNGQSRCTNRSTLTPSVSTGTSTFSCKVDRTRSMYYLNIAVQQACSGSNCVFYIAEGSSEFR